MNLDNAISVHTKWKSKFRNAIAKQETIDTATINNDNCCELGNWLYGEGKTQFGKLNSHADCVTNHKIFHVEACKVATLINAKKYTEAEKMIDYGTHFAATSHLTAVSIIKLKKEASL